MTQYIYPAVLTHDKQSGVYLISFYDLDLYTEGNTVEEAYILGKSYLENYIACALKFDADINPPSTYEETQREFKDDKILMIEAVLDEIKIKKL